MIMKHIAAAIAVVGWYSIAIAQDNPAQTLITNVNVFDGVSKEPIENAHVLIEGNLIAAASTDPINAKGATGIDVGRRTLMRGLTDCHWHSTAAHMILDPFAACVGKLNLIAAHGAEKTLMRGFTTVRDPGGTVFDLKAAIDEGAIPMPPGSFQEEEYQQLILGTDNAFTLVKINMTCSSDLGQTHRVIRHSQSVRGSVGEASLLFRAVGSAEDRD